MLALGARKILALPAQLCLPYRADTVSAALCAIETGGERDLTLALRLAEEEGIGLPVLPQTGAASGAGNLANAAADGAGSCHHVVCAGRRGARVSGRAGNRRRATRHAASGFAGRTGLPAPSARSRIWWPASAGAAGPGIDWNRWRWPLALAGALLLVNALALNLDWWRLKREADTTRSALAQVFQQAYPKETVIIDPVLQMRQKIAAAKREAGQPAPDDFAPLAAGFAEAWSRAGSGGQSLPAIAALEYRERALLVRIKAPGEIPLAQLQPALAARNLALTQQGADALQIRSAR